MNITCKTCKGTQDSNALDKDHIYCLAHTSDDNEQGLGLVCLNARGINEKSGHRPDCARIVVETKNKIISFRVGTNGLREDVVEL